MLSIKLIVDDMYEAIHRIPKSLMNDELALFLIPSIFLQKNKILHVCTGFEKCIKK